MNKILLALFSLCTFSLFGQATLEFRVSPLIPMHPLFREIYGKGILNYQIEVAQTIFQNGTVWGNLDYSANSGEMINGGLTHLRIVNGSFGFKRYFPLKPSLDVYLGIGLVVGGAFIKNDLCCSHRYSAYAVGCVLKSGFHIALTRRLFLNLFSDVSYEPAFFSKTRNIGGWRPGLGLGVRF